MKRELLYLYNICKRKKHQRVLRHVALTLFETETLGILGKNDSSLLSLCELLSGQDQADTGTFWYDGQKVSFKNMMEARQRGIYLIQKESALFSNLTVAENIGGIHSFAGPDFFVSRRKLQRRMMEFLEENEIPISLNSRIGEMSSFERCQVEIARAIYNHAKIVIFYQVGREFSTEELDIFRLWLIKLKEMDISVIYMDTSVSNLMAAADRMAIITAGKVAGVMDRKDYDSQMIQSILMKKRENPTIELHKPRRNDLVFCAKQLHVSGTQLYLDLEIHKGEIAGVYADSQTALALFEAMEGERAMEGRLWVKNRWMDARKWKMPSRYGVGCVSYAQGNDLNFPDLSVYENLMIRSYRDHTRMGFLNWRILRFIADENAHAWRISTNQTIMELQQTDHLRNIMFPLLSWAAARPGLLVLSTVLETSDEVEKNYLYQLLNVCRQRGIAVLYCMNREQEAMGICDKVYDPQGLLRYGK